MSFNHLFYTYLTKNKLDNNFTLYLNERYRQIAYDWKMFIEFISITKRIIKRYVIMIYSQNFSD